MERRIYRTRAADPDSSSKLVRVEAKESHWGRIKMRTFLALFLLVSGLANSGAAVRRLQSSARGSARVTLLSQSKRRRNLLIGVGIGLGVSLLLDRTLGVYLNNESGYSSGARAAVWIAPPAGFGALGAAAIPSHPVVYKAPGRRRISTLYLR